MLFLCLRFPYLPLEVFQQRYNGTHPRVVQESRRILLANRQAEQQGVKVGMSLATARSLIDGGIYKRRRLREQQCLRRLSWLAYRFTPQVICYRDDALLLEINSSLRLFKGLPMLWCSIRRALAKQPYDYRCGVAHTATAAWLLSYHRQQCSVQWLQGDRPITADLIQPQLDSMPVSLLVDFQEVVQRLQYSGIKQLGQVLAIPAAQLAKRFGVAFADYVRGISVHSGEPLPELILPAVFCRSVDYSYAINDWQLLLAPMKTLLIELMDYLKKNQLQCSEIHWHLWSPDQNQITFSIACQRVFSQWSTLLELTEIKLNTVTIDMAVEMVELRCCRFTDVELLTSSLFTEETLQGGLSQHNVSQEQLQLLLDKLISRLGEHNVYRLQQRDSHIPEQAVEAVTINNHAAWQQQSTMGADRPCWLLNKPQLLSCRQGVLYWQGGLTILQGPERIESNWWQQAISRDYFIVMTQNKQRCWIFRDRLQQQWYLHGFFA